MGADERGGVFGWTFDNVRELRRGLEEYQSFLDGTVTTHYGLEHGERDPDPEAYMSAARRRSEIDACMEVLQHTSPLLWRALDVHYRRGASIAVRGWALTAGCIGLRRASCPPAVRCPLQGGQPELRMDLPTCTEHRRLGCQEDQKDIRHLLNMATRKLYRIHQVRHESK